MLKSALIGQVLKSSSAPHNSACRPLDKRKTFQPNCDETASFEDLNKWLPKADAACLTLPKSSEFDKWLNESVLSHMKEGSILIILGSHRVVDEHALSKCQENLKFRGIALDAYYPTPIPPSSELWKNTQFAHNSRYRRAP